MEPLDTEAVLDTVTQSGWPVTICTAGAPTRCFRAWLGSHCRVVRQPEGDLGRRGMSK